MRYGCLNEKKSSWEGRNIMPRCVLCTAESYGQGKAAYNKVSRTYMYFPTCMVNLCVNAKGNRKYSCYDRWHNVKEGGLKGLLRCQNVTP